MSALKLTKAVCEYEVLSVSGANHTHALRWFNESLAKYVADGWYPYTNLEVTINASYSEYVFSVMLSRTNYADAAPTQLLNEGVPELQFKSELQLL